MGGIQGIFPGKLNFFEQSPSHLVLLVAANFVCPVPCAVRPPVASPAVVDADAGGHALELPVLALNWWWGENMENVVNFNRSRNK